MFDNNNKNENEFEKEIDRIFNNREPHIHDPFEDDEVLKQSRNEMVDEYLNSNEFSDYIDAVQQKYEGNRIINPSAVEKVKTLRKAVFAFVKLACQDEAVEIKENIKNALGWFYEIDVYCNPLDLDEPNESKTLFAMACNIADELTIDAFNEKGSPNEPTIRFSFFVSNFYLLLEN
ncbi:MAG: hypothetical protein PUE08_07215 [Eubacteriales bacterium]|nr:hypothetical protein [Eubacteriales bacterium]